ncbi:MAG: PEP-CTERM sorting domain-containing protein [Planctomycetota bacterium]
MRRFGIIIAAAVLFSLLAAPQSHADSTWWTGTTGSWHDPLNWDNGIPTSGDSAYIDNSGTAQISADADSSRLYAGYYNSGAAEQTGGTHTVGNNLFLGYSSGSSGAYSLSAGDLYASSEDIGYYGTGEFNQTGGINTNSSYLYIGHHSGSSGIYNLSAGELSVVYSEIIGDVSTGEFNQNGGTNTGNSLYLGNSSGSSGTYNLSAGELSIGSSEYIGLGGAGEFNQSGGTNIVGYLSVKADSSYNFSSGTLSISGSAEVNGSFHFDNGDGAFNVNGGLVNFTDGVIDGAGSASFTSAANTLTIFPMGFDPAAQFGSYNALGLVHNAGSTLVISAGEGFAGRGWIGDYVQSSGNIVASGGPLDFRGGLTISDGGTLDSSSYDFTVGNGATVTIAASGGELSARNEYIGHSDTGEFNQAGGTHTVSSLYVGRFSGGTYNLSAGDLSAGSEYIGYYHGLGEFNQTGGTNIVGYFSVEADSSYNFSGGTLSIGDSAEINGSFHFDNGDGTLNVNGGLVNFAGGVVDGAGSASFTSAANTLTIFPTGFDPAAQFGSYTALGLVHTEGSTLVISAGDGFAGRGWIGDYVQNSGNIVASGGLLDFRGGLTISDGGTLDSSNYDFTVDNGATAIIAASGGELSALDEYLGRSGAGEFYQEGGTHAVGEMLCLGFDSGSSGTYNLSAGELSVGSSEIIGYGGTGEFSQTGGTHTVSGTLQVGCDSSSSGTYNLSAGELSVGDDEHIGAYGTGEFNQTGGTHTVNDTLHLGLIGDSSGIYNLSVGELSVGSSEYIGLYGTGQFNQTGGINTVGVDLRVGYSFGSLGTYNLSAGELSVGSSEYIGYGGTGEFNQTGVTHTVSGSLYIGRGFDSSGTYNLSAGELFVGHEEYIGYYRSTGEFNQDGGIHTVSNHLYIGYERDSSGTYNQTGGINTVGNDLYLGYTTGSSGIYNFLDGELFVHGDIRVKYGYFTDTGALNSGEIYLGRHFINQSEESELFSMVHTTLTIWGGEEEQPSVLDMNSIDYGAHCAGLVDNFALGTLVFEGNPVGTSTCYRLDSDVYTYGLALNEGAHLDLNGHTLYYVPLNHSYYGISPSTFCLCGTWVNGDIVAIIPEPATIALIGAGLLGLASLARRKCRSIGV